VFAASPSETPHSEQNFAPIWFSYEHEGQMLTPQSVRLSWAEFHAQHLARRLASQQQRERLRAVEIVAK